MADDQLTQIFDSFIGNREAVNQISTRLDNVIHAVLASDHGKNLDNMDGFLNRPIDHDVSTIRTTAPNEYATTSQLVIDVFAEGRISIEAAWFDSSSMDAQSREERVISFRPTDDATQIASQALSAIVDINDNDIAEAFQAYAADRLSMNLGTPKPQN